MGESVLIEVDTGRCDQVARVLVGIGIPNPVEPWSLSSSEAGFDLATLNLGLVAICHQTQTLAGDIAGVPRRGWDYLQSRFLIHATADDSFASAEGFKAVSADRLTEIIQCGGQLKPTDIEHRAHLLRECGEQLVLWGVPGFTDVYNQCGRRVANGDVNLLGRLAAMRAFGDPVHKKSLFLLGLNATTCGWHYVDERSLDPPVDYHEVRGHLRIGTVHVLDDRLRHALDRREHVDREADIAIRTAVTRAIRRISETSGVAPMALHYAFWNLFRSLCIRGAPRCRGGVGPLLPTEYRVLAIEDACCFVACCNSVDSQTAWDEHRFETDWY